MSNSSIEKNRLHYLDAARAFALILGIVFHAGLSFMPIFIGWAVMDISTSHVVSVFSLISHSFRLELFFLIAGFFSHMKFHKDGSRSFFESRVIRIGVPFIIGWIVLRPLLVSGWILGTESMRGETNIINGLVAGFSSLADFPKDSFVGTHLWFLYYLLVITGIFLLARTLIGSIKPAQILLTRAADYFVKWLSNSRLGILVISIPTAACLWFMSSWGMDTPDKSLKLHIPVSLIYGGFFLFGWMLHRQIPLLEKFARLSWEKITFCVIAIVASIILSGFQMQQAHPQYSFFKSAYMFSYAVMMWSLVSLTIGIFKRLLDRPSEKVRYVADASYWLYLIHLPIVVWLQIAFAELAIHWSIKWVSITMLALVLLFALYEAFVRSTYVGKILNGRRKPRILFRDKELPKEKMESAS